MYVEFMESEKEAKTEKQEEAPKKGRGRPRKSK